MAEQLYRVVIEGPDNYRHVVGDQLTEARAERVERGVLINLGEGYTVHTEPSDG